MKQLLLITTLMSYSLGAQSIYNIEGVNFNTPCEMTYTRNIDNQNNYSCILQDNSNNIINYSLTVNNLYNDLKGLSFENMKTYKQEYFNNIKKNSDKRGEQSTFLLLNDKIQAIALESYATYGSIKFRNTELIFLYKKKSFILNLATNNFDRKNDLEELINSIIFN